MSDSEERFPWIKKPVTWIVFAVVFAVVSITLVGIFQYTKVNKELAKLKTDVSSGGTLTDERQRELITEVSSRIMLPADEKPTVAVVSDINRLKDQQFFTGGQNGDVVLIYMNARKAVLYRPSEKKIIEVAPVNLNNNNEASVAGTTTTNKSVNVTPTSGVQAAATIAPTPTPAPSRFALRNGTTVTGLAQTFGQQLQAKLPKAQITERGNAAKRDYSSSIIVDITGKKAAELQQVAVALGIAAGVLPEGEVAPSNADYLIIIGADKK